MWSCLMYGLRSIHAPVEQYFALSSGPGSIATSGAVPLLIARRMSEGSLPPTLLPVIHWAVFFKPASTLSNCLSSRPVKKLQTVSVTGLCELFAGGPELLDPLPAVHAVTIMVSPIITGTARRFIPHPQSRWRIHCYGQYQSPEIVRLRWQPVNRSGSRQTQPESSQIRRRKWTGVAWLNTLSKIFRRTMMSLDGHCGYIDVATSAVRGEGAMTWRGSCSRASPSGSAR